MGVVTPVHLREPTRSQGHGDMDSDLLVSMKNLTVIRKGNECLDVKSVLGRRPETRCPSKSTSCLGKGPAE